MRLSDSLLCVLWLLCLESSAQTHVASKPAGQLNLRFAKLVSIKVKGGPEAKLIEAKPGKWEGNLIIYLHGNSGLNQMTASRVEELARRSGAVVICPDLLTQRGNSDSQAGDTLRMLEIVRSCVEYGGKSCRVQVLAWGEPGCSLVLKAAAVAPERFYGAVLVDGLPAADTVLMPQLEGPLLLIRNKVTSSLRGLSRDAFSLQMSKSGKVFKVSEFSPAGRTVAASSVLTEIDEASWQDVLGFLKQNFQEPMRRNILEKP